MGGGGGGGRGGGRQFICICFPRLGIVTPALGNSFVRAWMHGSSEIYTAGAECSENED